jgi:DNA-binding SARP family transcriptional activator
MSDKGGQPELRIHVIGAFRVLADDGEDLTPRGRKARALLAMLALTPTRRRSRPALQDKLWSDRGPEQGAASLRQTLTEIRRAFGDKYRDSLVSDMRGIGFAPKQVVVDFDAADFSELARQTEPPQLLEDLDVADEEFENWVRNQRTGFEQRIAASRSVPLASPAPAQVTEPNLGVASRVPPPPLRPWVRLLPPLTVTSEDALFFSHLVGSRIVQGLIDQWAVDPCEDGKGPQGVQLRVDALPTSGAVTISMVLLAANSATQLWSHSETLPLVAGHSSDTPRLQALISRTIEVAGYYLNRIGTSADGSQAFTQAFEAVQRMFKIDLDQVDRADALLTTAYELNPQAVYLAWRAYARSFYVGEHVLYDRRRAIDEAEALARRALEADPHNPTVLALVSYVYSFILRESSLGHELAKSSIKFNPAHPLGHAFLGRAKSYLGEHEAGYRETCRALQLSGQTPYQFTLHFLYGMTALLSGRLKEAVRASEISCALAPTYRPPQRYLVPLYLKLGERDKARAAFEKLRRLEPTFSLDAMRDASYPSAGIRASGLLTFSDRDL